MAATLQDSTVMSILNEVHAQIGVSTIKCMSPFSLRLMLATTAVKIINGLLVIEAFKTIKPFKPNYEEIIFPGVSLVIEGFLFLSAKFISGDNK